MFIKIKDVRYKLSTIKRYSELKKISTNSWYISLIISGDKNPIHIKMNSKKELNKYIKELDNKLLKYDSK
jgi:hypothetical protein